MKILSTNIADIANITFRGKTVKTGIYKKAIDTPIFLGKEDVKKDFVVDRKYHGGYDKACYLYSYNHYAYWQKLYPNLLFEMGMFGENLTIENLYEQNLFIGDIFKIGEVLVQVSQPREPCFKLGVKFDSQKVIKQFLESDYPGVYLRVIKEGLVKKNDRLILIESPEKLVSVLDVYKVFSRESKNIVLIEKVLQSEYLATASRNNIQKM